MEQCYINDYLNSRILITGNKDDYILSCHIHYDLNKSIYISPRITSRILLNNTLISKKYMKASQYYIGLKYR